MAQTDRVTGLVGNTGIKAPVKAATTAAIVLSGAQTIDGVSCVAGDRVLVKNQASGVENGIYLVDTGAWSRAPDFDGAYDALQGTLVRVSQGTVNAGVLFALATETFVIGTDSLSFSSSVSNPLSGDVSIGTNAGNTASFLGQTVHIYNSGFGTADYERLALLWNNNIAIIRTEAAGTGVVRDLKLTTTGATGEIYLAPGSSTNRWKFEGVSPYSILPIFDAASNLGGVSNRVKIGYFSDSIFVNDSTNAGQTIGITINQGAADDELLSGKSSDVAHGVTTLTETDTYVFLRKLDGPSGGLEIVGLSENTTGISLRGLATVGNSDKGLGAEPPIVLNAVLKSGTGQTAIATGDTLAAIQNNGNAVFVVDADSNIYLVGTTNNDKLGNSRWFLNDTSNANMTFGLTINQGAASDEIITMKSSLVDHGSTTNTETDTFGRLSKVTTTVGGLQIEGYSESTIGTILRGVITTATTGARSTASVGAIELRAGLISGTAYGSLGADANILSVRDHSTTRFVLDSDGDSHQDVGTAWTNFDDQDDIEILNAVAVSLAREGDPLRADFNRFFEVHRDALEALPGKRLVSFNDDGHHFMNMSRLAMLHTGAIRQLGRALARHDEMLEEVGRLRAKVLELEQRAQ